MGSPELPSAPGQVHPHARGAYWGGLFGKIRDKGSSPRPWGIYGWHIYRRPCPGFIPTPVGHILNCQRNGRRSRVHPHARGAYSKAGSAKANCQGSSPRPWGIYQEISVLASSTRFIPTPVGHIATMRSYSKRIQVHPHARGAYQQATGSPRLDEGSSPRPWGILHRRI